MRSKTEALEEVAALSRQMQRATEQSRLNKFEEKGRYQDALEESKRSADLKVLARKKEHENDMKFQAAYKQKLDDDEEKKQSAVRARTQKYDAIGANRKRWESEGAGKEKAEIERRQMEIVMKEAKIKEDREDARHFRDIEKVEEGKRQFHKYNTQLMNERKQREEDEAQYEARYATSMLTANQGAIDREARKEEKRRSDAVLYKGRLVEQQREQRIAAEKRDTEGAVSSTERKMNKNLFDKLRTDEELISKINQKFVAPARPGDGVRDLMADGTNGTNGTNGGGSPNKARRKVVGGRGGGKRSTRGRKV